MEIGFVPPATPDKPRWNLNAESLNRLLQFLDANPTAAANHYEQIRDRLMRFFEWKGCIPGDAFADETIDRVAKRLAEGIETQPDNPYLYFHGVAVNLVRERWRKADREPSSLETVKEQQLPAVDPQADIQSR
jgi:DNA-directed RNA polymerase specialized sigma24 family protein